MAANAEIEQGLAELAATLNDQRPERFDRRRVQAIAETALGGGTSVDRGGGVHDESGRRVGVVRRAAGGEWFVERQNPAAARASSEVPVPRRLRGLRHLLTNLKARLG